MSEVLIYIAGDKPAVIKGTRADLPWLYMPMTLVGLAAGAYWEVNDSALVRRG